MIEPIQLIRTAKVGDFIEAYADGNIPSKGVGDPGSKVFAGYVTEIYSNAVVVVEEKRLVNGIVITWLEGVRNSFDTSSKYKFKIFKAI